MTAAGESPHHHKLPRQTFRLLMEYAEQRLRKAPSQLSMPDLDTPFLGAVLEHLEQKRDNSTRSRNVRLAAIHSFFRYVSLHAPEYNALAQRVLAMPSKRYVRRPICFLTPVEIDALLAAPDLDTWSGRRDRALLLLAVQTGLRAAELTGLRCENIALGTFAASARARCAAALDERHGRGPAVFVTSPVVSVSSMPRHTRLVFSAAIRVDPEPRKGVENNFAAVCQVA